MGFGLGSCIMIVSSFLSVSCRSGHLCLWILLARHLCLFGDILALAWMSDMDLEG